MSKDPMQRYAESLEKTIQHNYSHLKEMVEDFKGLCLVVTPEKHTPQDIIVEIRELFKEIRDRLAEIKAIQQLLQGKYRQYYRRDSLRDKMIMEFGFLTKNLYSKFEYILLQKQARHLTLFCLRGKPSLIDEVYSRLRLREHDIIERYAQDELHGLLTHLREVNPVELEKVFQRILESEDFSKLKCLLITIHSPKDLEGDRFDLIKKTLDEMEEGKVKTLKFLKNPEISDCTD